MALIPEEPKAATAPPATAIVEKQPWPKALAEQVARAFKGKVTKKRLGDVESLLDTLVALGQAAEGDGRYSAG